MIDEERQRIKNKILQGLYITDRQLISLAFGIKFTILLCFVWMCAATCLKLFNF